MAVSAAENGGISIQIIGAEDRNWASSDWSFLSVYLVHPPLPVLPLGWYLPQKLKKRKAKWSSYRPILLQIFQISNMSHNNSHYIHTYEGLTVDSSVEAQILFLPTTKDKLISSHSLFSSHVTNMTTSVSPYFKMQTNYFYVKKIYAYPAKIQTRPYLVLIAYN